MLTSSRVRRTAGPKDDRRERARGLSLGHTSFVSREREEGGPLRPIGRATVRDRFGPALRPLPLRLHNQRENRGFEREEGGPPGAMSYAGAMQGLCKG